MSLAKKRRSELAALTSLLLIICIPCLAKPVSLDYQVDFGQNLYSWTDLNKIDDRKSVDRLHNDPGGDKQGVFHILNQGREGWIIDMSTCQRSPSSKPKGKEGWISGEFPSQLFGRSFNISGRQAEHFGEYAANFGNA